MSEARIAMKVSIGPLLFGWPEGRRRDWYLEVAGDPAVDIIYLGEVVCSKRMISGVESQIRLADELRALGKEVVLSSLAMPCSPHELQGIETLVGAAAERGIRIEANDMGTVSIAALLGIEFVAGPHLNVYTPYALKRLSELGAARVVPPLELPARDIPTVTSQAGVEVEYFAHGKLPLTFSARCYSARARGLSKRDCHHTCFMDPDGMEMLSLDQKDFATINGVQIMSHRPFTVIDHVSELKRLGVGVLRLSPQVEGMAEIIRYFRAVADGVMDASEALHCMGNGAPFQQQFCNGYYHGRQGRLWIEGD